MKHRQKHEKKTWSEKKQRQEKKQWREKKQEREKRQERERNLKILEDMSVVNALLIMVLALIFLIDIAGYEWVLQIILILGVFLNFTLALYGLLRKKWIFGTVISLVTLGYLGVFVYSLISPIIR